MRRSTISVAIAAALAAALALGAQPAGAVISTVSGSVVKIAPPASVRDGALRSNALIRSFDEAQDVRLTQVLYVNGTASRTYNQRSDLTLTAIPAGTYVRSHLFHGDRASDCGTFCIVSGGATFDRDIIGIIVLDGQLDASDGRFTVGTLYPTNLNYRGMEFTDFSPSNPEYVVIGSGRRGISVQMAFANVMDQLRVITYGDNRPPVAVGESYTTPEDTPITVGAPGLLANDSDPNRGDAVAGAELVSGPAHGTVSFPGNGSFTYAPAANYNGPDTFTYRVFDLGGARSSVVAVAITVIPVCDTPVATGDSYATNEDTALSVPPRGVLVNDTDADGDVLTASLVAGPSKGALTLRPDGSLTYTPGSNLTGADSFTYRASDPCGRVSNVATVSLTIRPVADAPIADDEAFTLNEDVPLVVAPPGVLDGDTDADGDALSSALETDPAHGTISLAPDGSLLYTPGADFNGADSFTYRASDGALTSAPATVSLTILPVNDAPVARNDGPGADPDPYAVAEDTVLTVVAPGVLANDSDVDGDPITAAIEDRPGHGTVELAADGSFVYTPDHNYSGTDVFTYRASDGTAASDPATVTIDVLPIPDDTRLEADPAIARILPAEGDAVTVFFPELSAHLAVAEDDAPVAGATIDFYAAGELVCSATTDEDGRARCGGVIEEIRVIGALGYEAMYAGSGSDWNPSADHGALLELAGQPLP